DPEPGARRDAAPDAVRDGRRPWFAPQAGRHRKRGGSAHLRLSQPGAPVERDLSKPVLQLIQNLAPAPLQREVWQAMQAKSWYFGNQSNEQGAIPFWKMDLEGSAPVTQLWAHARPH